MEMVPRRLQKIVISLALLLGTLCACANRQVKVNSVPPGGALVWLFGEWRGFRFEPSSGERAPVVARITPILAGAGEQETLDIQTSKGLYHGLYTEVTEPKTGKSVIIYVNSNRRSFARLEGNATSNGGEWLNVVTEGAHRSKLVYERPTPRTWRRTQYVSEDSGQSWSILWVDDLKRQD